MCVSLIGIIKSKHSRRALPIKRSQEALAWGGLYGVFKTVSRGRTVQKLELIEMVWLRSADGSLLRRCTFLWTCGWRNCKFAMNSPVTSSYGRTIRRKANVDDFVAVKAPDFNTFQQALSCGVQKVQSKASKIHTFLHLSTNAEIWFGTKRPEVRILSPRFCFQGFPRLSFVPPVET